MPHAIKPAMMFSLLVALAASVCASPEKTFQALETYLEKTAVYTGGTAAVPVPAEVFKRRDPETKFGSFVYSINRRSGKLLSPGQAKAMDAVIEKHKADKNRYHDERNSVRCRFLVCMWEYAGASNSKAKLKRKELEQWFELWMAWRLQENMVSYHFAADAWNVLDAEQRQKLLAGEWDEYVKKNTGHTRLYRADKLVRQALGAPKDKGRFENVSNDWKPKFDAAREGFMEHEVRERRIMFSQDLIDEQMIAGAWQEQVPVWHKMFMTECDAVRDLCQSSYSMKDSAIKAKLEKTIADINRQMLEKYQAAGELHNLPGVSGP
ncbi:MAG: hypothetical protein K9M45_04105 [Kiritimatiellales bacterium]|nr:hypothetical protein [Kiritimatiellales bacterium]